MSGPGRDEEFEAFLRQRSVLSGGRRVAQQLEPSRDLDDIVLSQARQAIQSGPPLRVYRSPRWALPVALAATLLLSMSIVLNVSLNARRQSQALQEVPQAKAGTGAKTDVVASSVAAPAAPSAATAPTPPAEVAETAVDAARSAPPAPALEVPAAPAAREAMREAKVAAATGSRDLASGSLSAPASETGAAAREPGMQSLNSFAAAAGLDQDPKAWLQWITALRSQGRTAAADAQLRRFRAAYPDFAVPPAAAGVASPEPGPSAAAAPAAPPAPARPSAPSAPRSQ